MILGLHITGANTYHFLKRKGTFADFVKFPLEEKYQNTSLFKTRNFSQDKLCLFCKSTVWWKTSPKTSFERVWDFESSGAWENLKIQTLIKDMYLSTKSVLLKAMKLEKWKTADFIGFVNRSLHEKLLKDTFWQKWWLLKAPKFQKSPKKIKFSPFLRCKFELFWQKRKLLKVLKAEKLF